MLCSSACNYSPAQNCSAFTAEPYQAKTCRHLQNNRFFKLKSEGLTGLETQDLGDAGTVPPKSEQHKSSHAKSQTCDSPQIHCDCLYQTDFAVPDTAQVHANY